MGSHKLHSHCDPCHHRSIHSGYHGNCHSGYGKHIGASSASCDGGSSYYPYYGRSCGPPICYGGYGGSCYPPTYYSGYGRGCYPPFYCGGYGYGRGCFPPQYYGGYGYGRRYSCGGLYDHFSSSYGLGYGPRRGSLCYDPCGYSAGGCYPPTRRYSCSSISGPC